MSLNSPAKTPASYTASYIGSRLYGYHIQQSLYGTAIPIIYGRTRVDGNVLWSGFWSATPLNGGKGKGGKGGKGGNNQQYDYKSSLVIGICQGPVTGITGLWVNQIQMQLVSSSESYTVPSGGGSYTPTNATTFISDNGAGKVSAYNQTVNDPFSPGNITYSGTQQVPLTPVTGTPGAGQYSVNPTTGVYTFSAADAGASVIISYTWAQANSSNTGVPLENLSFLFFNGALGQAPWSLLTSSAPSQAVGYSELCYVAGQNIDLGSSGLVPEISYEVQGFLPFGNGIVDAAIDAIIKDYLSSPYYGAVLAGFNPSYIDLASLQTNAGSVKSYCLANNLFIAPLLDQQRTYADWLSDWAEVGNFEYCFTEGKLKFLTRGDTTAIGNGVTFTPNTTPIYDLDDDDYLNDLEPGGDGQTDPITVVRPTVRDAYNQIPLEWWNRGNDYNAETLYEEDPNAIDLYGTRTDSTHQLHCIVTQTVAVQVANTLLKYSVNVRNQYKFKLPSFYGLLEPMDLITISDPYLGMDKLPVRILEIVEEADYTLTLTVEDFPWGTARPTKYGKQVAASFGPGYFSEPGNAYTPVFFEAPTELTQDIGFELFIGLSGAANWGGCHIWVSTDGGNSYSNIGIQYGPTTMGELTAGLAAGSDPDTTNTISVDLTVSDGELPSYTKAQADAVFQPVAVLPEILSYETATLTGSNMYNLTYLRRGQFGSAISAHAIADPFLVLDGHCFSYVYDASQIGQTLYFKFTSFNKYNQSEQALANVTAYPYRITSPRQVYPWKPGYVAGDPVLGDPRYTFSIQQQYIKNSDGSMSPALQVYGASNLNLPSQLIKPPTITYAQSTTGGSLAGGQTILFGVQAYDAATSGAYNRTGLSNAVAVVIPSGTNTNSVTISITWPSGNFGGEVFAGATEATLGAMPSTYPLSASQASVTITSITEALEWKYGPIDPLFDHRLFRFKAVLRGGWNGGIVTGVTTNTITMGIVPGITLSSSQIVGRFVTLVARSGKYGPYSATISSNPSITNTATSITLTFVSAHSFQVNDTVALSTLATTHGATTVGDNLLIQNAYTDQYLMPLGSEDGSIVRIISGTGAVIDNDRKIISHTMGTGTIVYTVDHAFDPPLDGTSVFIVIGSDYYPPQDTHSVQISQFVSTTPAIVKIPNVTGMFLLEGDAADENGNLQAVQQTLWRFWYTTSQASGYFVDTISSNQVTPDMAEGLAHEILLNQAPQITIQAPIWTGGAIMPGIEITIAVLQDSTGQRPAPLWATAYGGMTTSDKQISAVKNTINIFKFKMKANGNWQLFGNPVIGKPVA